MNLFPILEGTSPEVERTLYWRTNVGNRTMRAVRSGDWKLVVDSNHEFVFNLRRDIGERRSGGPSESLGTSGPFTISP